VEASQVQFVSAANGEGSLHRRYATPLAILMAMSGAILLVGCLNLANLQLARLTQREREFAIRIALGASRARILRQVAMEVADPRRRRRSAGPPHRPHQRARFCSNGPPAVAVPCRSISA
jgi:hypothetical protein